MTGSRRRVSVSSKLPDVHRLTTGLSELPSLAGNGKMTVISRKPNPFGSTFPTEIVKCRLDDRNGGKTISFFIKYGTKKFDGVYGHRGNVSYEARVYQDVLQGLGFSTARFYGVHKDEKNGAAWLILEYMGKGRPASWSTDTEPIIRSAGWIGKFHATNEKRIRGGQAKFLRRYDADYYRGWARRARRLFRHGFPWLAPLCNEFERKIPKLLEAPQTIIHGEYFGSNILYQRGVSRPTDWQSAAIAPGEVDLASLTHSWISSVVRKCEREYARSRWPSGIPEHFQETLDLARAYMSLRWLGDPGLMSEFAGRRGRRTVSQNVILAMQAMLELHSAGHSLGLIQ